MEKYKRLIAVCGFTSKLFHFISSGAHAVSTAGPESGASHRVPRENK